MSNDRKYKHAPDDAPLYRVSKALGGGVWPAFSVYLDGGAQKVCLDIDGALIVFFGADVHRIAQPEGLPEWVLRLVRHAIVFEDLHGDACGDERLCFSRPLADVPASVREYVTVLGGRS